MPYFSSGEARDKLILLFFLQHIGCQLTREQLYRVMMENEWMNYFEYRTALNALEKDGYCLAVPRSFGQGYTISQKGEETLELFYKQLPLSLRESILAYIEREKEALSREMQYSVRHTTRRDGNTRVELKVLDDAHPVLELNFDLPDLDLAVHACERWPKVAEDLFREILNKLVTEK